MPHATIARHGGQRDLDAIAAVVRELDAERVVLGLPLGPDGEVGRAAKSAQTFAERLRAALSVPVDLIDESFSTVEAEEVLLEADVSRARRQGHRQARGRRHPAALAAAGPRPARREDDLDESDSAMKRALVVFLVTIVVGLGALGFVARTAWRYGDTASGAARAASRSRSRRARAPTTSPIAVRGGAPRTSAVFRLYAGQRGVAGRFKAGRYEITAPATPRQILETLVKGAADELVAVTIPEGKNLVEIAEILDAAGIASKAEVVMRATDPAFAASLACRGSRSRATSSPTPTGCGRARPRRAR